MHDKYVHTYIHIVHTFSSFVKENVWPSKLTLSVKLLSVN